MTTLGDLISETEEHLLAGDRDTINQLASSVGTSDTTFTFTYDNGMIQAGAYVSIDLEVCYVWSTNDAAKTAVVQRAMVGSTAAAHTSASLVYVNPRFSKYRIARNINQELRDLSAPPNGLWQVKSFTTTTFPVQKTYAIPSLNTDILYPLEVRYIEPGPEVRWIRIPRWDYTMLRDQPTTGSGAFASGMALRIEQPMYPGRTLVVKYAGPFSELANLTDDAVAVSGIPSTAVDIPPLGAAARLMGVREAKRTFVESEPDSRRAGEVPVGSASKAAATILSLLNERIRTEFMRLTQQWPETR